MRRRFIILIQEDILSSENLVEFIKEGVYFDNLSFDLKSRECESNELIYSLSITCDSEPFLITISKLNDPEQIPVFQYLFELSKPSVKKTIVEEFLNKCIDVIYTIEFDHILMNDDSWEMLDSIEGYILEKEKGLLYVNGEGFYNKNLKIIYKL